MSCSAGPGPEGAPRGAPRGAPSGAAGRGWETARQTGRRGDRQRLCPCCVLGERWGGASGQRPLEASGHRRVTVCTGSERTGAELPGGGVLGPQSGAQGATGVWKDGAGPGRGPGVAEGRADGAPSLAETRTRRTALEVALGVRWGGVGTRPWREGWELRPGRGTTAPLGLRASFSLSAQSCCP